MTPLFNSLVEKPDGFLAAKKGAEFEDRVETFLRNSMGYSKIQKQDIEDWEKLRKLVLMKFDDRPIDNSYDMKDAFMYQPNGTQNYPDFLVFEADEVICIETKFARPPRPVWNSGPPRPNGFYILGTPKSCDITFFRGCDVVSKKESEQMHNFFDQIRKSQDDFNREHMRNQRKGFSVYIRKAFAQGKQHNKKADIDFYNSPDRKRLEQSVLDYFLAKTSA